MNLQVIEGKRLRADDSKSEKKKVANTCSSSVRSVYNEIRRTKFPTRRQFGGGCSWR